MPFLSKQSISKSVFAACMYGAHLASAQASAMDIEHRVDALFSPHVSGNSPGCAVGVVKNGELVLKKGYGNASLEFGIPIDPDRTLFNIASTSKQFTAAAILLLVQDKKIALTDDIRKYLPELRNITTPVTIDQMLSHTSGLRDYTVLMTSGTGVREVDYVSDDDAMAIILRQKALNFMPGSHYMYSNTNYFLLAKIVERVSGTRFGEFLKKRIFEPLDMRHTIVRDKHDLVVAQRATGYTPQNGGGFQLNLSNWESVGSTGILTTVADLAKWDHNFIAPRVGGHWMVDKLQENAIRTDGVKLTYARGLHVDRGYRDLKSIHHAGAVPGFVSELLRLPEQKLSVMTLCNDDSKSAELLTIKVTDLFLAHELEAMRVSKKNQGVNTAVISPARTIMSSAAELQRYAGLYLDRFDQSLHKLEVKNGRLLYFAPQRPPETLEQSDAQHFRLFGNTDVSFELPRQGIVQRLTIHYGVAQPVELERVKAVQGDQLSLEDYAGTYFSPDINVRWTIVVKDGKLFKQAPREPTKPMDSVFEDAFAVSINDKDLMRFTRDSRGRVAGFIVDNPRVLNVIFSREGIAQK